MQKKYRKCVGMMILNARNQILVGRRLDHPSGYWQMPQGGIDENENPEEAVWREMMEEIGTNNALFVPISSIISLQTASSGFSFSSIPP